MERTIDGCGRGTAGTSVKRAKRTSTAATAWLAGAGATALPFGVPSSPSLAGAHLYLQAFVYDPGASAALSMTPGLALRFCD